MAVTFPYLDRGCHTLLGGILCALLLTLSPSSAVAQQNTRDAVAPDPMARARELRDHARQLGARNDLPAAWHAYENSLSELAEDAADAAKVAALELEGMRLVNRAAFLREIRDSRAALERLLDRYDRSLREIAALMGVSVDPALSGDQAAARLLDELDRQQRLRKEHSDSLQIQNRQLQEQVGGRIAAQDSLITALRVEISALRHRLWETELRAGVAEADRSAAESMLSRRQAREAALREIMDDLADRASAVMRPEGVIVLQVHGLDFNVGSADLAPGQAELMNKLAAAVGRFPAAAIKVEGHTDDTGSRPANLALSKRRAVTVAGGIERRLKLPEGSVDTAGHGPDRPVAPNSTPEGRARNRRIDIVITPSD